MTRILRARKSGQPGMSTRTVEGFTGDRVSADRETKSSVRRLFARNPAKHQTDPLGFTNNARVPNPNAAPNPRILDGSSIKRRSVVNGIKHVVNRGANRSLRKR